MGKKAIVYTHQRNPHTFFWNELKYISELFDRVIVISPKPIVIISDIHKFTNIEFRYYSRLEFYKDIFLLPLRLWRKEFIKDLYEIYRSGKLSLKYLVSQLYVLNNAEIMVRKSNKYAYELKNDQSDWFFLSMWYSSSAYAAAIMKKKYPLAYAITLAHSFEVDPIKDEYTNFRLKKYMHFNLDHISFISKNRYEFYMKEVATYYNLDKSKVSVDYLGCEKIFDCVNQSSSDEVFRLVSCSNVNQIKRVEFIADILSNWTRSTIEWVHIGDGPDMEELKRRASLAQKNNIKLNIKLVGNKDNEWVHKFYSNNPVDLLISVSTSEGIPVSFMEAMSYGIPVIATNVGGNFEIIDSRNGLLVPFNSDEKLIINLLLEFYEFEESTKENMRRNAFETWNRYFNSGENRISFYKKVISHRQN